MLISTRNDIAFERDFRLNGSDGSEVVVVMEESLIKLSKNWNLKRRIFNQKITQARERKRKIFQNILLFIL